MQSLFLLCFLVIHLNTKGYICYDNHAKCFYLSKHVVFDDDTFPYKSLSNNLPKASLPSPSIIIPFSISLTTLTTPNFKLINSISPVLTLVFSPNFPILITFDHSIILLIVNYTLCPFY